MNKIDERSLRYCSSTEFSWNVAWLKKSGLASIDLKEVKASEMTIKVQSDYLTAKANSVCDVTCFMFEHSMLKSKKEKKKKDWRELHCHVIIERAWKMKLN